MPESNGILDYAAPGRHTGSQGNAGRQIMRGLIVVAAAALALAPAAAQETRTRKLDPADAGKLRALIKPSENEARWDQIPWRTSLWDARMKAAAEGKPLLIWEANGNPIGIT